MTPQTFMILQAIFSVCFIVSVLLQDKGSELSLTFGGSGDGNSFYGSKQGVEKMLERSSYLFSFLFLLNAILYMFLV
jgi:protein translocase SecG subunit